MSEEKKRVVIVTGANGGLGSHLVDRLLKRSEYTVVCVHHERTDSLEKVLEANGTTIARSGIAADLTNETDVRRMVATVLEREGSIWGAVNLAGVSNNALSWKISTENFLGVLHGSLLSTFLVTRELLPILRQAGGGRIINTSSIVAHSPVPGTAHYAAAKGGIESFTKTIASETASKGITANALALGYFRYGLIDDVPAAMLEEIRKRIPVGRLGDADDLFRMVNFLLGDHSAFVTGQVLHVNGGQYTT